jgi:cell division transport system permease protein
MLALLQVPAAARELLPQDRRRTTPWVIAVMMFVTAVVAAASFATANAVRLIGASVAHRHSIQIPGGAHSMPVALAAAGRSPGVLAATAVPEAEVRGTLERWLGPDAAAADLPLPALIDLELAPGADPALVAAEIRRTVPQARVLSYSGQLEPVTDSLRALQWLALGLVALMSLGTAAIVMLATRGAFDTHRATIEIAHGIGATDDQLARLFAHRMARDALLGGFAGVATAALVLLLVLAAPGGLGSELAGVPVLRSGDWLLLAVLPLGATAVAMAVARTTVLKSLRAAL